MTRLLPLASQIRIWNDLHQEVSCKGGEPHDIYEAVWGMSDVLCEIGAIESSASAVSSVGQRSVHPLRSLRVARLAFGVALPVVAEVWARLGVPDAQLEAANLLSKAVLDRVECDLSDFAVRRAAEVQCGRSEERARLSRELHDRVAHTLAVELQRLEKQAFLSSSAETSATQLVLREAIDDVRGLCGRLRRNVDHRGLRRALLQLLSITDSSISTQLRVEGDLSSIPLDLAEELFLGVREAFFNAMIHSATSSLTVSIEVSRHEVVAVVVDTGSGFESHNAAPLGVGLLSIRERMEIVGGSATVRTTPCQGTTVRLRVPLVPCPS